MLPAAVAAIFTVLCCTGLGDVTARLVDFSPEMFSAQESGHEKNILDLNLEKTDEASSNPATGFLVQHHAECYVEVVEKVPGRCEKLGHDTRACIAGSYMNLFDETCL
ncbi:unnamed protein product [Hermetia illucens]|uniref:Uncharacterized protein n=1 Tax=Hermetia illucens TaxID=343691 RepID=A0A7R8UGX5_HERIL|nr:unnamed protein product [Hermetia illucens]